MRDRSSAAMRPWSTTLIVASSLAGSPSRNALAHGRVDHDQLAGHPPRLGHEGGALIRQQVAVEVAGEHAVELAVGERQRHRVTLNHGGVRQPRAGDFDHRRALIEAHHLAAQVLGEKSRAAGDVEHSRRR